MSADNYIVVRYQNDKYYACMGFASNDGDPEDLPIRESTPSFFTEEEVIAYCDSKYLEYGWSFHSECPDKISEYELVDLLRKALKRFTRTSASSLINQDLISEIRTVVDEYEKQNQIES